MERKAPRSRLASSGSKPPSASACVRSQTGMAAASSANPAGVSVSKRLRIGTPVFAVVKSVPFGRESLGAAWRDIRAADAGAGQV